MKSGVQEIKGKHTDRLQRSSTSSSRIKSPPAAVTHRSYVNESGKTPWTTSASNTGDSVLALVVNEYLFKHFEDYGGKLAKIKSAVVSEATRQACPQDRPRASSS